ncbi:hypothetical protein [Lysinibacillus pakistanensis]|uniref:hypothetical protein n=1 Tax=Lysinibacillus pakistanensis TaxID=759811 RepID=UPI00259FE82F|nr:hypothetical protein [Lysinibacillus pakistanensis]MDM5233046.1 hypothetical protein [Lysinibacillus pakistanensis]
MAKFLSMNNLFERGMTRFQRQWNEETNFTSNGKLSVRKIATATTSRPHCRFSFAQKIFEATILFIA